MVRVWDIARGRAVHVLAGHTDSVRCLEVSGNLVVSGSYDATCRVSHTIPSLVRWPGLTSVQAMGRRYGRVPACVPRPLS
jgi:WD40 repeat protein